MTSINESWTFTYWCAPPPSSGQSTINRALSSPNARRHNFCIFTGPSLPWLGRSNTPCIDNTPTQ